ncbi:hypothetical protein BKA70DRAFT_1338248 [Coprinopsis sp. MPI-PUGE-AT-0042]|nr:hypothetical protein BKA70DRAFT_1338248 [Coprinopsis sp. MPI-PUGE-AT-0042]
MGAAEASLGALLIAVVVNTFLFGIGIYQYISYYTSDFRDPVWIKRSLAGLLANDVFHSCLIVYIIWDTFVPAFLAPPASVQGALWPLPTSIISVSVTALVVQNFLSYRVLLLARSKVLAGACSLLAAAAFALGITVAVKAWNISPMDKKTINDVLVTTWLSLETVVDVSIAVILLFVLRKEASEARQSSRVFKRLARISVQTGLCSSVFALLCMLLWLVQPGTNWYLIFGLSIGRVYTCSLLDTLLGRPALRAMINPRRPNIFANSSFTTTSNGATSMPLNESLNVIRFSSSVGDTTTKAGGWNDPHRIVIATPSTSVV